MNPKKACNGISSLLMNLNNNVNIVTSKQTVYYVAKVMLFMQNKIKSVETLWLSMF